MIIIIMLQGGHRLLSYIFLNIPQPLLANIQMIHEVKLLSFPFATFVIYLSLICFPWLALSTVQ
jgi:hypothetical protein